MHLTPREQEKLMIVVAADLARRRRERGLLLNYPEAVALITHEILEGARDGRSVQDLMSFGATILTEADVMQGVSALVNTVQVEATFPDGTKLVTVHHPIRPRKSLPPSKALGTNTGVDKTDGTAGDAGNTSLGQPLGHPGETVIIHNEPVIINEGRATISVKVTNTGDRPVQVGSHYHFAEVNAAMEFDREATVGFHLDIPAGTSARFEPGDSREVQLVEYGGNRAVYGFHNDINGPLAATGQERA